MNLLSLLSGSSFTPWIIGGVATLAATGLVYRAGAKDCMEKATAMANAYAEQIVRERDEAARGLGEAEKKKLTHEFTFKEARNVALKTDKVFSDWYSVPLPCLASDLSDGVRDESRCNQAVPAGQEPGHAVTSPGRSKDKRGTAGTGR